MNTLGNINDAQIVNQNSSQPKGKVLGNINDAVDGSAPEPKKTFGQKFNDSLKKQNDLVLHPETNNSAVSKVMKFTRNVSTGAAKDVARLPIDIATTIGGVLGLKPSNTKGSKFLQKAQSDYLQPKNTGESVGGIVSQGAQLLTGTEEVKAGQEALKGAAEGTGLLSKLRSGGAAGKAAAYLTEKSAQAIPEAAQFGGYTYARTGDAKEAKNAAIGAGVFTGLTHVGSDAFTSFIPQGVKDNVSKVLGFTGKMGLKDAVAGQKVDKAVSAFETISKLAPSIKVVDENGIPKVFDPTKATFHEMPQALYQAKNMIYDAYSKLASEAGDEGANFGQKEFTQIKKALSEYEGKGFTPAFSNKAKQISEAIDRFGKVNPKDGQVYFKNVPPGEVQKLIENINLDVNPLSDKAGSQVANDASSKIRGILDGKIETALEGKDNPGYQKLRTAYSQLKSIEPDIVNQYKKVMRKAGVGSDLLNGLSVVDSLQGIVTGNPVEAARGAIIGAVKKAYEYFRDPEVNLRRAFSSLKGEEDVAAGKAPPKTGLLKDRLFGKTKTDTEAAKKGSDFGKKIKDAFSAGAVRQTAKQTESIIDTMDQPGSKPACVRYFLKVLDEFPEAKPIRGIFSTDLQSAKDTYLRNMRTGSFKNLEGFTHVRAEVGNNILEDLKSIPKDAEFFSEEAIKDLESIL